MIIIEEEYINSTYLIDYIFCYAHKNHGVFLNITQLNKIMYFCLSQYLYSTGKQLTDELPEAWPYGPVFPNAREYFLKGKVNNDIIIENEDVLLVVNEMIDDLKNVHANKLSSLSNRVGGACNLTTEESNTTNFGSLYTFGKKINLYRIREEYYKFYYKKDSDLTNVCGYRINRLSSTQFNIQYATKYITGFWIWKKENITWNNIIINNKYLGYKTEEAAKNKINELYSYTLYI